MLASLAQLHRKLPRELLRQLTRLGRMVGRLLTPRCKGCPQKLLQNLESGHSQQLRMWLLPCWRCVSRAEKPEVQLWAQSAQGGEGTVMKARTQIIDNQSLAPSSAAGQQSGQIVPSGSRVVMMITID